MDVGDMERERRNVSIMTTYLLYSADRWYSRLKTTVLRQIYEPIRHLFYCIVLVAKLLSVLHTTHNTQCRGLFVTVREFISRALSMRSAAVPSWGPLSRGRFPLYASPNAMLTTESGVIIIAGRFPAMSIQARCGRWCTT
jgi:hypothetical protein